TGEIEPDRIPDLYNLQVGNLSAKFIIDYKDGKPLLQKYDDIKIVNPLMLPGSHTVTDKEGFKYKFQVVSYELLLENITIGNTITHDVEVPENPLNYNTWHLTEIKSPNGDVANFIYEPEVNMNLYRRNYDKFDNENGSNSFFSSASRSQSNQFQLKEIRFNYNKNGNYSSIVFEAIQERDDIEGKELNEIHVFRNLNSPPIKSFYLHHSYMVSPDNANINYYLKNQDPKSYKRLVLDSISVVGKNNTNKPPYVFTYNSEILPNRFSNSQDFWGYYNGAGNGHFLDFNNNNRTIDTTLAQAGMLEKITYPTGGSVNFYYEHNKGKKGIEFDGIRFPKVNPGKYNSTAIAAFDTLYYPNERLYKTEIFSVGHLIEPIQISMFSLPEWNDLNQSEVCITPANNDCRFSVYLVPIVNGEPEFNQKINIYSNTLP